VTPLRTAALEEDLQSLEGQLETTWFDEEGCLPYGCCRPFRRYYGAIEMVLAKPRTEDGAEEDQLTRVQDFHLDETYRVCFGYSNENGFGLRSQFWRFDRPAVPKPADHVPIAGTFKQTSIDAYTVDCVMTQDIDFCRWELVAGIGARYAFLEQRVDSMATADFVFKRFDAVGPLLLIDMRRPVGHWGFAWIGNVRGSLLAGRSLWSNATQSQSVDDIGTILEMQMGLEWKRQMAWGWSLFIRGMYEQQTWYGAGTFFSSSNTVGDTIFDIAQSDYDIAFIGFAFTIGFER
jgi:hypothetical protein